MHHWATCVWNPESMVRGWNLENLIRECQVRMDRSSLAWVEARSEASWTGDGTSEIQNRDHCNFWKVWVFDFFCGWNIRGIPVGWDVLCMDHSQDIDKFRFPHKMRIKKVHSQSEWWYHRVAHVCLRINPNNRWYITFLRTFRECSILLPDFDEHVRNWSKLWKTCQKSSGCLENGRFYRESA